MNRLAIRLKISTFAPQKQAVIYKLLAANVLCTG